GLSAARDGMREARFHWPVHPWTTGSYARSRPGQWTTLRGASAAPAGNRPFGGQHCAFATHGVLAGSEPSGGAAARAIRATRAAAAAAIVATRAKRSAVA